MIEVTGLWIYPIKSCRGIALDTLDLDDRGPRNDRRWMLVDDEGGFVSQRQAPRLALIDVALAENALRVSAPGMQPIAISPPGTGPGEACTLFRDTIALVHVASEADAWFAKFLGLNVRLMYMPDATERLVDRTYSPEARLVSLADAFPLLLIGEGSLELLNEKLAARGEPAIPMQRFRPNIVITGTKPHEEDNWTSIRIGDVACSVVKPCARCTIPTVEISTGQPGKEPLRTLAEYRKRGSKVLFGQNLIHGRSGRLNVGNECRATCRVSGDAATPPASS